MSDNIDVYVSRSLKNWAARSKPPEDRLELLRRAAASDEPAQGLFLRLLSSITVHRRLSPEPMYVHSRISTLGPFTLSTLWSFHMVTNQRLAT